MKIIDIEQNTDQWLEERKGKITGSKAKSIFTLKDVLKEDIIKVLDDANIPYKSTALKATLASLVPADLKYRIMPRKMNNLGFYQLVADKLGLVEDYEDVRDRGHRLEGDAIKAFEEMSGKKVTTGGMWVSDENPNIAYSPDGSIYLGEIIPEACEIKCLSSARHLQALDLQKIPEEYEQQLLQAFIVNENLQTLYFCFYDPRVVAKPMFYITVNRKDVQYDIDIYKPLQVQALEEVDAMVARLTF